MTARAQRSPFALAGIAQPLWLLGASLALGLARPGYDPFRDGISELAEVGAPTALLWSVGGFGVVAILHGLYSVAVRAAFGTGLLFGLTVAQAVLMLASAAFQCDPGCPPVPETPRMVGHTVAGLSYFVVTTILPLVAWRTFRKRGEWRSYGTVSLATGILLVILFVVGPTLGQDRIGIWQRTVLVIAGAWQAGVALRLLRPGAGTAQRGETAAR